MKVIHSSPTKLIIEDRPWLLGVLLIGMALAFAAGSLAFFASREIFGGLAFGVPGVGVPLLIA
ncbi:MAG: hypothetical protein ABI459_03190, partial [Deltaproteobacteria bacterium]